MATTSSAAQPLLGPLTTTYTPSNTICTTVFLAQNPFNTDGWLAFGAYGAATTSCFPSNYDRDPQYFFSPGLCPSGYSYASVSTSTFNNTPTTTATCCPFGYSAMQNRGSAIYACLSYFTEAQVLSLDVANYETFTVVPDDDSTTSTISYSLSTGSTVLEVGNQNVVMAYGFIIQRATNDLPWSISSTAPATKTSSTQTMTATSGSQRSSRLSPGVGVGIGVGAALGILLIAVALFVWLRRKKRARNSQDHGRNELRGGPATELEGNKLRTVENPATELEGSHSNERSTSAAELDAEENMAHGQSSHGDE